MKTFLNILGLLILSGCSTETQTVKTDLEEMKLVGKVMSIEEYSYETGSETNEDQKEKGSFILQEVSGILFNDEGGITEKFYFDTTGTINKKEVCVYDNTGRKIETNTYNPEGILIYKEVYKYDANWKEIERTISKADSSLFKKFEIKYNNRGQMVEVYKYDSTGGLEVRDVYKYRDYKEPFEINRYLLGRLVFIWTFEYDSLGNITSYEQNAELNHRYKKRYYLYEFDSIGNWTKQVAFENEEIISGVEREIKYW